MIDTLSQVLKHILDPPDTPGAIAAWRERLHTRFPTLRNINIAFDRPSDPYSVSESTINLFLYDVRENAERRINERTWTRSNGQVVIYPPPLRVACSYLVTVWSSEPTGVELAEQRLLSQVLQVLSGFPTIPSWFLEGTALDGQEPPLPMVTAQADGIQNPAEFWNAIGNKLRPSLTVTVTISVSPFWPEAPEPVPVVVTRELAFEQPSLSESERRTFRIGGRITNAAGNPVEGAVVALTEGGRSSTTDRDGYYSLGSVALGDHTLRIQVGATTQEATITVPTDSDSAYNVQLS